MSLGKSVGLLLIYGRPTVCCLNIITPYKGGAAVVFFLFQLVVLSEDAQGDLLHGLVCFMARSARVT